MSIYWNFGSRVRTLTQHSAHFDLLYKSEDVTKMAMRALADEEVRLLSNSVYDQFDQTVSFDNEILGYIIDMPGFGHTVSVTAFPSKPY